MNRDFQVRSSAILLSLFSLTALVFAWLNFQKERQIPTPYDGVFWVESGDHLMAQRVDPEGPGEHAGIKTGDELIEINSQRVHNDAALTRQLYRTGIWSKANYQVERQHVNLTVQVILAPADKSPNIGLRLIALIYLGIGIYVLLRRWTAPKATHFYIFCLVSFIFYSFKYTGKFNLFDWSIYWCNMVAGLLQPALFLHFAMTFPSTKAFAQRHRWLVPAVYVPAVILLGVQLAAFRWWAATELLRWNLDRIQLFYMTIFFAGAAAVLWHSYRHADNPILRQQMRWVTRGTILAIAPYTLFYVVPFMLGAMPSALMKTSVLSLIFLPLTFGYAIVRYRLMDVDIIFKRGMTYTLATSAIVGMYFLVVAITAEVVHTRMPSAGPAGLIVAIIITSLLFEPVKKLIQDRVDRLFYHNRYDYRRTLIGFGRDLSAEPDLETMLSSVVDRLSRTLLVDRIAIFLAQNDREHFSMARSFGLAGVAASEGQLDFSFLTKERPGGPDGHVFFDNPRQAVRQTPAALATICQLDLNYFIPCRVQNRTIAILGLGKTKDGDFLSSDDVELLETLAGYIGIAIQNGLLYASLEEKVMEYERLKDFNENIVESINVGVLAVDLEDRIESWNSQMEVMYATPRALALDRSLSQIFPPAFMEAFYRVRQNPGIHNLYKFRLGSPSGETRIANIAIAPLVTRNFQVIGRLIIVDDITERLELESQLSQAEKMSSIGLLAAGVAHEVNTPLAVISSYAQMLAKRVQGDPKQAEMLAKITGQTFRASEIVNNLLNFSRTSGVEFNSVDLNQVLSDTLALLEHQLKIARVQVEEDLAPDLPPIFGSANKLQQVFLNLFLNARDAMPGGGTLKVSTANGDGVNVTITDTGSGIAQEHIARIYDPFFTTKSGAQGGQRRGTGLGLSVSYGIIQEHAGKIRVNSRPGEGTTFCLAFPTQGKAVQHV